MIGTERVTRGNRMKLPTATVYMLPFSMHDFNESGRYPTHESQRGQERRLRHPFSVVWDSRMNTLEGFV